MRRVRVTFSALVATAVVATGALSTALRATPGPATGLTVAVGGAVLVIVTLLAGRILVVVGRRR